jgi:hypothetical protein
MAEILPNFLSWLDQKKSQLAQNLMQAVQDPAAFAQDAGTDALRSLGIAPGAPTGIPQLDRNLPPQTTDEGPSARRSQEVANPADAAGNLMGGGLEGMLMKALPEQVLKAEAMERAGKTVKEIWQETGANRFSKNGWMREIPDSAMTMRKDAPAVGKLPQLMDHPELFSDPEVGAALQQVSYRKAPPAHETNYYVPGQNRMVLSEVERREVPLHETGHAVQDLQGMAEKGANPQQFVPGVLQRPEFAGIPPQNLTPAQKRAVEMRAYQKYYGDQGEEMARIIMTRASASPAMLKAVPPTQTPDSAMYKLLMQMKAAGLSP